MGAFTGIGDFFRGVFGEDENEKRRRKQREAQQAQQRQQQAQAAQQQMQKQQLQSVNQMFGAKPQLAPPTPVAKPTASLQQTKPPAAKPPAPKPKAPLPIAPSLPTDANGMVDFTKPLVKQPKTVPIKKGSTEEKFGKAVDTVASSTARVATGVGQGFSGLFDLVTPGKGTNRVSKSLDKSAKEIDKYAKDQGLGTGYKVGNVVGEAASYLIPTRAAATIATKLPKATKLTEDMVERVAGGISNGAAKKSVRGWLGEGVRRGMTLEDLLADQAITSKYIGENASKGRDTSPSTVASDVAAGVGANVGLRFIGEATGRLRNRGDASIEDVIDDAVGAAGSTAASQAIQEGGRIVKPWYQNAQQPTVEDIRTARELGENPRFGKKEMTDAEQAYREVQAQLRAAGQDTPAAVRQGKEAYDKATADFIQKNGILTDDEYARRRTAAQAEISKREAQVRSGLIKIRNQQELEDFLQTHENLLNDLETHKKISDEVVANAKANDEAAIQDLNRAVADAEEKATAQVTPPAGEQPAAPAQAPEVAANNGYGLANDLDYSGASTAVVDAIGQGGKEVERNTYKNPLSKLFFKKQQDYVEAVDAARAKVAGQLQKGIDSGNKFSRGTLEAGRLFFKNFGQSEPVRNTLIKRTSQLQNAGRVATASLKSMEEAVKRAGDPAQVYERIYRVLETPDFLERVFGDATKLTPDDLSPAEREAFDQLVRLNKIRNDINLQTGLINREQHAAYADGMHSPRIYDINVEHPELKDFIGSSRYLDLKAGIKRKDIKDVPDYVLSQLVDSPFQASALRLEGALKNLSNSETLRNLDELGGLPTSAPSPNYVPLLGKKYGQYEGRFIDKQLLSQIDNQDYYNSELGQKLGDTINQFHNSVLGAPGRAYKKFRTTLSPGTIVGNIGSGQFAFSGAVNINPATSLVRTIQATKQLADPKINPAVQEAELAGLFAGDTGRVITNSKEAESAVRQGKKNAWGKANDFYGGIDKATALGWYNELRARGLTPEQAVSRVHLGMQNYSNAGRAVNALSDAPILGKPFARFTPELLRIAKNSLVYNPLGTAAKAGVIAGGAEYLSNRSGETPEERKAREEAPGQTKIGPVSLNIPVGDSSVNIARAIGLNFPQEPNGDPGSAIIRQLNPLADITRTNAQGEQVFAPNQVVSDMFYRQIADQVANRDFMGRSITDPENKTYYEDGDASVRKFSGEPSDNEQLKNRARSFAQGLPFAPEVDNILSAATGNEDFYDKKRSMPQALGRLFGVKVESNNKEARQKRTETQQFFDEDLAATQQFVRDNPDLANAYYRIKSPTRDRKTNTKTSDLITPEKWDIINSDTSGRLFNFFKSQELRAHDRSVRDNAADPSKPVKPIDPVYTLPADQAKYVAELRSRPSGDDVEAQEILRATSTWYADYEDKYHAYLDQNSKYFDSLGKFPGAAKENARVKEYGDASVPIQQPEIIKQYYQIKNADPERAKEVYKANKEVLSKAFDDYAKQRLDRINKQRKIEGYEPISLEVFKNKTFGFDVNGSGFGFGSGGGRTPEINTLGELTNFTNDVNRIEPIEAQAMPALAPFFGKLTAGAGGSRRKPTLGASSRGV